MYGMYQSITNVIQFSVNVSIFKCNIDRSTSLDEQFVCMPSGSYFVSLLLNIDYSSR